MLMAAVEKSATPEGMDKFEQALFDSLQTPRKYNNDDPDSEVYYENRVSCDYGPCQVITDAMKATGIEFTNPIKTNIWIEGNCISVSAGYGAREVYHYPISDGRWLITTLRGEDISKVIEYVEGGTPEFTIEEP